MSQSAVLSANLRLDEIKRAAVTAFDVLFDENSVEIMDAETRAKREGDRRGKTVKFKLGFKVVIDDENHEAKHTLGWSFGFQRSRTTQLSDPDQPELPHVEPEPEPEPEAPKAKRKRAAKSAQTQPIEP